MALIEVKNITAKYGGEDVIKDISFEVERGDYLLVVGENGTGKSTLLKVLTGLWKHSSGEVNFNCINRHDIGYLPQQNTMQKNFPAKVFEIVCSGFSGYLGALFLSKHNKEHAKHLIEHIGLKEISDKPFANLSGGQQQKVLLARALVAGEGMLLLDEPVASLDPAAREEIYATIEHYNKVHGTTVIMVTHDIEGAIKYANKVLSIGENNSFCTAEEYLKNEGGAK